MKGRSISLILCFLLAFVLAGCGGETTPTEETTPAEATAAALDPAIAEALQVSEDMADDLSAGVQDLDLTSEQELYPPCHPDLWQHSGAICAA